MQVSNSNRVRRGLKVRGQGDRVGGIDFRAGSEREERVEEALQAFGLSKSHFTLTLCTEYGDIHFNKLCVNHYNVCRATVICLCMSQCNSKLY